LKLPSASSSIVPERKITLYLLNPGHPAGGSKAVFFLRHGFSVNDWKQLAESLRKHAQDNAVVLTEETPHGVRYVIDGPLLSPVGTRLNVRTAWFISPGEPAPRFVTAHPLPKL
jgi:hypothetical protein